MRCFSLGTESTANATGRMPKVKVAVRCRPTLPGEAGKACTKVDTNEVDNTVRVQSSASNSKVFSFDHVIPESASQADVFENIVPMIDHALDGLHATVFAYGQTGSGKTFTMEGLDYVKDTAGRPRPNEHTAKERHGIIPRTIEALFEQARARMRASDHVQFRISVSYMQLYNEKVTDLLNPSLSAKGMLKIRWNRNNKFTVDNLFHLECETAEHTRELFAMGVKNKVMGSHALNQQSSRSHCLFTFHITQYDPSDRETSVKSELTLVDLAGSEKLTMLSSDPSKVLVKESIDINASLLALGKVITALATVGKGTTHVPYRDSKLTKLLQHALGGNSMTMMLACISPLDSFVDETLSTLMYAGRARNITNDPHVNEDPRTKLIRQLRAEIVALKEQVNHYQQLCESGLPTLQSMTSSSPPEARHGDRTSRASGEHAAERELADKLIASCEMLKHLIDVNRQLREAFDNLNTIKSDADRKETELEAENASLRERIEVLEAIVLDSEGGQDSDSDVARSQSAGRVMRPASVPQVATSEPEPITMRTRTPTQPAARLGVNGANATRLSRGSALRDSVEFSRASGVNRQHQELQAYSKKYRQPQSMGDYSAYYGLAKKATERAEGRQAKLVSDVDNLLRKSTSQTVAMVPLSLQSGGNYGSLSFGGTRDEIDELEARRRRREERRAQLEEQHRRLQQGFAVVDSALGRTANLETEDRRPAASSSDQLFNYLSASESASVFTADQLQRLRERRAIGGPLPMPANGGRRVQQSSDPLLRNETQRAQEYQKELASAQTLVSRMARSGHSGAL
jgi:hypothetical protein